jgi:hypothetical protein
MAKKGGIDMKPFAAIDLTHNKKNETCNGEEFCCAKPSDSLMRTYTEASEQVAGILTRSVLPTPLKILEWICMFVGLTTFIGILRGLGDAESLEVAYNNAAAIFWICGISLVGWFILWVVGQRRQKAVLENEDNEQTVSRMNGLYDAILAELSVPSNAREVDILTFQYKDKNGKLKHVMKGNSVYNYMNLMYRIYGDEENLYLVNADGKYAFPKTSLKAIHTKKERVILASWNKDTPHNEGFYKQFKLQENQYGGIITKPYHILELEKDGETWGIYFPCYELPTFEVLTGLKAE